MKRAFIIHGWGGNPDEAWMPWLRHELRSRGFQVIMPVMPDTDHPRIDAWVAKLEEVIRAPDEETYLIGHSIGCQAIIRYLGGRNGIHVGHVVLVAPWVTLHGDYDAEELAIAGPWLQTPLPYDAARSAATGFTAIFSDDDPDVPLGNKDIFADKLGARIVVEHGKGHFSEDAGIVELPVALSAIIDEK